MADLLLWKESAASPVSPLPHLNIWRADLADGRHYDVVPTVDRQTGKTFRAYVVWYWQDGVNEGAAIGIGEARTVEAAKEIAQRHATAPPSLRQRYNEELAENRWRATVH